MWVERADRVLEDHLRLWANFAKFFTLQFGDVASIEQHAAGSRLDQLEDALGQCGFTTARFAHNRQCLARDDVEADARHCLNFFATLRLVFNNQVVNAEDRGALCAHVCFAGASHGYLPPIGKKQRYI